MNDETKKNSAELNDDDIEKVSGGVSEEELNGRFIIKPTSESYPSSTDIGCDIYHEMGNDWDSDE